MNNNEKKLNNILEKKNPRKIELTSKPEIKAAGAISEIERRLKLDDTVEDNLSSGLETDKNFVKKYKTINKKKVLVIELVKNKIKKTVDNSVDKDATRDAIEDLESEIATPFNKNIYSGLAENNRNLLIGHLIDNAVNPEESEVIHLFTANDTIDSLSGLYDDAISYSDNGYIVQLANKKDLKSDTKIDDKACLYNLISPDGKTLVQKIDYASAIMLLKEQAENYQNKLKEGFNIKSEERNQEPVQELESQEDEKDNLLEGASSDSENPEPAAETGIEQENAVENGTNNPEFEPSLLFNKYILSRLSGITNDGIGFFFENSEPVNRNEVNVRVFNNVTPPLNIIFFSNAGYMLQLMNKEDITSNNTVNIYSGEARYNLITPDGSTEEENLNYSQAEGLLRAESETYLKNLNQEFEANKVEIEKELDETAGEDVIEIENNNSNNTNQEGSSDEPTFISPFNEKVSRYAESIGIEPEELATNQEFLLLSSEQQRFALETLRRTSFAKARVEAHQTFAEEKAGKKWWQVGFAMNQNFHKERHKIEAIKNIESRGLEGYGETELAWLVEVIKNGPEIRMNDEGEVIVNCLQDRGFSDEQKELIAKYNEEARYYIEDPKTKKTNNYNDTKYLNEIKQELLHNCTDEERDQLFYSLNESEKNIQLLKFLSANEETEEIIKKMAGRSLTGFDKAKAMVGAQKDKAGYSALGFALRTGSKFALANGAYVASALSYSTAPLVAAMVGGLRGYNQGRKSLVENNELAQLGIEDKSDTAKSLNSAVGTKNNENGNEIIFGLKDKLDNLVDKLEKLRAESFDEEEIKKTEDSLRARIYYTKGKMDKELVSYGSLNERGTNYLELTNSLVRANSIFYKDADLINSYEDEYYPDKDTKKLTRQTNLYKGLDVFNKIPDVSDPNYREWAQDKERFEALQELGIRDRLASFLDYKDDAQSRKELKFLLKKTATGAVMGASFAAVGSFVAEHLGVSNWLNDKFHWLSGKLSSSKNLTEASLAAKSLTNKNLSANGLKTGVNTSVSETTNTSSVAETPTKVVPKIPVKNVVQHEAAAKSHLDSKPIDELKVPLVKETKQIDTQSIKIPSNNQEVISTNPDKIPGEDNVIPVENGIGKTAGTETLTQEVLDGKKAAGVVKNLIDVNNNAAKIADNVYGNNVNFRTEEGFLKQVSEINGGTKLSADEQLEAKNIFDSFKQNNDYNILRKRLVDFEGHVSAAHANEVTATNAVVDNANHTSTVENTIKTPASTTEQVAEVKTSVSGEKINQVVENTNKETAVNNIGSEPKPGSTPENPIKIVLKPKTDDLSEEAIAKRYADSSVSFADSEKYQAAYQDSLNDIRAGNLAKNIHYNDFKNEEGFLKHVSEINGVKLSADEQLEAKNIYHNYRQEEIDNPLKDHYGAAKEKLYLFEKRISDARINVHKIVENSPTESVNNAVENARIADKISIASELHTKPEALEQVGNDLVYKGAGKSNIVFDLKAGGIKEVVDTSGKKIPNEFVTELMNGSKLNKFTRGGGLEKIFTSWNKLGSNDKLIYESLGWFNKKTMSPEDLLNQIKGVYKVKTENVFIDTLNKHFTTGDGRNFDMSLKGVKRLVAFLPKNS